MQLVDVQQLRGATGGDVFCALLTGQRPFVKSDSTSQNYIYFYCLDDTIPSDYRMDWSLGMPGRNSPRFVNNILRVCFLPVGILSWQG